MKAGQLVFPALISGSFWVIVQGHGVIPEGRRFLVVEDWGDGWWLAPSQGRRQPQGLALGYGTGAWRDGVVPVHQGTLLKEEHFRREGGTGLGGSEA